MAEKGEGGFVEFEVKVFDRHSGIVTLTVCRSHFANDSTQIRRAKAYRTFAVKNELQLVRR